MTFRDDLIKHVLYPATLRARGEDGMWEELEWLEAAQNDASTLERAVEDRLGQVLDAALNTPHYGPYLSKRGDYWDDPFATLQGLPILTKNDLQTRSDALRNTRVRGTVVKTTGGSTGQPVTVVKNPSAVALERAATWLGYGWFGIEPADRAVRLWGSPTTLKRRAQYWLADLAMNRIRLGAFGVDERSLASHWGRLRAFRPRYVYGYASMLAELASFGLDTGLSGGHLGLAAVISTSEPLPDHRRRVIQRAFEAPVQNEYGCGEVGPIAYECREGSLHIMNQNVVVEVVRDDGTEPERDERGRILITDLNNTAMPLLRYDVGDRAARGTDCSCGRALPTLGPVEGRTYALLYDSDGRAYHGEAVMYLFEDLQDLRGVVRGFQVVQEEPGSARVRLIVAPGSDRSRVRGVVSDAFRQRLGGMVVQVQFVTSLPRNSAGKVPLVVQKAVKQSGSVGSG